MKNLYKSYNTLFGDYYANSFLLLKREWATSCPEGGLMDGKWVLRSENGILDYDDRLKVIVNRNNIKLEKS